jgi:hypothetical protein
MSAQTSYTLAQRVALAGMIYGMSPRDIVSRSCETVAGAAVGIAMSRGTDKENQVVIGGTDYAGVSVRSLEGEGAANTAILAFSENDTVPLMREGYIWIVCPTGCNPGDAANYVDATGVIDSGAAAANETNLLGAEWDSVAGAGELAVLRLGSMSTSAGS